MDYKTWFVAGVMYVVVFSIIAVGGALAEDIALTVIGVIFVVVAGATLIMTPKP